MHPNQHINTPTPIQELHHPVLSEKKVRLFVKRDDLTHPEIMGNKWRKLKYNIMEMQARGMDKLLTFGGAYSNHIAATAAAGKLFGFETLGVIRGEELDKNSNSTLQKASNDGMRFCFVNRTDYRKWRENPDEILSKYPDYYFLPEGGTNKLAIKGAGEIIDEIDIEFDYLACAIGTGGTFCGLVSSAQPHQKIIGISSLKGTFIHDEIENLLVSNNIQNGNYKIYTNYHFGGYGKVKEELTQFINWFQNNFSIEIESIYTGKAFFAVWNMITNDFFKKNSRIILIHTGGLQSYRTL